MVSLLFINPFFSLHPFIIESNQIEDVLKYIDDETLIIFDIDNTIARLDRVIGSDVWFYHRLNSLIQNGKTEYEAMEELLPLLIKIYEHSWLIPVEECVIPLIKSLQEKNIKVIALTSRNMNILDRTFEQLHRMGLDFKASSLSQEEFDFTFNKHDQYRKVAYKDGVIFCGKNNKGDILMHIFIHLNYYPDKVIFVDDKRKYLQSVQQAMNRMGIAFLGIRYGACDDHITNYDPVQAEEELKEFYTVYS